MMPIVWLIIAVIFLIGEFACPVFFMFWFSMGSVIALITSFFTTNIYIQIVVFLISSFIMLIFMKPLTKKVFKNNPKVKDELNINGIVGKNTLVTEEIDNSKNTGRVKINGEVWRAVNENESEVISPDTQVTVVKVVGVKLVVKKN